MQTWLCTGCSLCLDTLPVQVQAPSVPLIRCLLGCPSQRGQPQCPPPCFTSFICQSASNRATVFYTRLSAPQGWGHEPLHSALHRRAWRGPDTSMCYVNDCCRNRRMKESVARGLDSDSKPGANTRGNLALACRTSAVRSSVPTLLKGDYI